MFTLFAIARYMNSEGWINKKDSKGLSEVFKLANVTLSSDKKMNCCMSYIVMVIFISGKR